MIITNQGEWCWWTPLISRFSRRSNAVIARLTDTSEIRAFEGSAIKSWNIPQAIESDVLVSTERSYGGANSGLRITFAFAIF